MIHAQSIPTEWCDQVNLDLETASHTIPSTPTDGPFHSEFNLRPYPTFSSSRVLCPSLFRSVFIIDAFLAPLCYVSFYARSRVSLFTLVHASLCVQKLFRSTMTGSSVLSLSLSLSLWTGTKVLIDNIARMHENWPEQRLTTLENSLTPGKNDRS